MNTQTASVTAVLVDAIESTWTAIRERHPDVPEVVVTIGSGSAAKGLKLGHFAADRWVRGNERVHELFVGAEGLKNGGRDLLGTLLHEAAHGAAQVRGIKDTSRQGRFHNTKFQQIGKEFGLRLSHNSTQGWSETAVPDDTVTAYGDQVAQLDAALVAYRITETIGGGRKSSNNGVSAECDCARKIRVSKAVYESGPILCGLCGSEFRADADELRDDDRVDG